MPLPRLQKWFFALSLVTLCLGAFMALRLLLPLYIETKLLPRWAAEAGLDAQTIRLRRIGWGGADTGPIRLNLGPASFGEVAAIQIDYSPVSLLRRRIDGIVLSGVTLSLTLNEAGNAIEGWEPPAPSASSEGPPISVRDLAQKLPVGLKRLALRNAMVRVQWRGQTLEIPLEMDLDTGRMTEGHIHAAARLAPRGSPIHLTGTVESRANTLDLTVTAESLETARFTDLLALFANLPISGQVDLNIQGRCRLQPFGVASFVGEARFSKTKLAMAGASVVNSTSAEGEALPIVIRMKTEDAREWPWSVGPFTFQEMAALQVSGVEGRLTLGQAGWRADATAHALVPAQLLEPCARTPLSLTRPLALGLALSARTDDEKAILWDLRSLGDSASTDNGLQLQRGDWHAESQAPRLISTGRIAAGAVTGRLNLSVNNLLARSPQATVRCPSIALGGDIATSPDQGIQATAEISPIQLTLNEARVELPRTMLEARLHKSARSDWGLTGELRLADGRFSYDPQAVQIRQISVRLPVEYPLPAQPPDGEVSVGQMLWQSKPLGGLRGKLGMRPAGLWADLHHASKLFPGLNVQIRSEIGGDRATLSMTVPGYTPAAAIELGRIVPAAEGFNFQGRIAAEAELRTQNGATRSTARVRIDQGVLRQSSRQLVLEGIACDLRLEDLIALRSAPRQRLQVADLTLGKLAIQAVNIDFQLESNATLFIEKAGLQWCKGMLQTQAFRLTPGRDEAEVTVYCDRLNLAMVMEQLGAAQGSGEGAVSGRIPVRWRNGELTFDNGFLYSTPGQTGTIQLRGTQNLLDGLAPGTPQHTQLDIASEALKDYTYNWAKVELQSQNDLLLVSLKLDGKPNRLLPFAYDPQAGAFKRFSGQGQAEFQGINIDLNFKTPLREILHYRQLMTPPKQ